MDRDYTAFDLWLKKSELELLSPARVYIKNFDDGALKFLARLSDQSG